LATTQSRLRAAVDEPPVPSAPAATRRSYPILAAGLLAALVGALLFSTMASGFDKRHGVLAVARPVAAGEVLTRDDLQTIKANTSSGAGLVAAEDLSRIVGRTAAVPLVAGSLLAPGHLGSATGLESGQAAVGLLLDPGRFPPGLRSGDRVAVVSAPTGPLPAGDGTPRLGTGVVEAVASAPGTSGVTARLRLGADQSDVVAAEGAARRVALVLLPSGEGK
jgi:hypothetical protein